MPVLASLFVLLLAACTPEAGPGEAACHVGIYAAGDQLIDLSPLSAGGLRWRTLDGETGSLSQAEDGLWAGVAGWTADAHPARFDLGACGSEAITVSGLDAGHPTATRVSLVIEETRFAGAGVELAGRLVLPPGEGPFPLAVLVHGSGDYSALDYDFMQRMLPARGVAVLVYDKRGTGTSTGEYTQDFALLAADAAAALDEARRLAGNRIEAAGYFGASQGGWVAPRAAMRSDPDFVVVTYGLAVGPAEEDRLEVVYALREAGYSEADVAAASEVAAVTGRLMATRFREGGRELARLKREHGGEPWFEAIEGEFSRDLLRYPLWLVRLAWPFVDRGTPWGHDPAPALDALDIPVLWLLAGSDAEAPSTSTQAILERRRSQGQDIDIVLYPDADHGMRLFRTTEGGERLYTRYVPGYFQTVADWILNEAGTAPTGH
ncbi:alpha/beta hydrolase family protein [Marinicauda algicola]|nr:alpha/beta hydrolase [Marinicauda algicola]